MLATAALADPIVEAAQRGFGGSSENLRQAMQLMNDGRTADALWESAIGDLRAYTQFQAAQSIPIAAANPGGVAGMGVGLGAGIGMGGAMVDAMRGATGGASSGAAAPAAPTGETKFCMHCGKSIPASAKFCPECGGAQA